MMVRRTISGMILGMVLFSSCYYDVAETLYPTTGCNTTNMTYVTDINPILEHNCLSCHSAASNTGNITLEGYDRLIPYVNNGRLLGAIKHQSGFTAMPENAAALGACDIAKIQQWIMDGAQNN